MNKPFLILLTSLMWMISPSVMAQDTLYSSEWISKAEGKQIAAKYRSELTGGKQTMMLRHGIWNYYDDNGKLLKTCSFQADKRALQSRLNGPCLYYHHDATLILSKTYSQGVLKQTQAFTTGIIIDGSTTIQITEQLGKMVVTEFVGIKKPVLINPETSRANLTDYLEYEKSHSDSFLLIPQSFGALHNLNHIQNPGFENHPNIYYSFRGIGERIPGWEEASPSPDFYLASDAYAGNAYAGFRPFGIVNDIEYIRNMLVKPLEKDQLYCFSMKVKLAPQNQLAMNHLGVLFNSNQALLDKKSKLLIPQMRFESNNLTYKSLWMTLQCSFIAAGGENYVTIGSFTAVDSIRTTRIPGTSMEVYYFMDDVSLVPIDQPSECPCNFNKREAVISNPEPKIGDVFVLTGVFFELDKDILLPESRDTIDKLYQLLIKHPNMEIAIHGHTSSEGSLEHNIDLSRRRALSVRNYLINAGIDPMRLAYEGHGPKYPIASNETEEGRMKNRRVEITILSM